MALEGQPSSADSSGERLLFHETFEQACAYYMSIGMSYEDYWDGDPYLVRYYAEAHKLRVKEQNMMAWLQAQYIYEVMGDMASLYNPFSKTHKAEPFRNAPYDLYSEDVEATKERLEKEHYEDMKARLKAFALAHNEQMKDK